MANDFSKGKIWQNIVSQAIPLTLAQLVQLLYNIVDRVYIGHLPGASSMALTGIGLTFPVTVLIAAFTSLFSSGGTPLFSIARGSGNNERAAKIMNNVFVMLIGCSVVLFIILYLFRRPILYLFGASDASYVYADAYLKIYLFGTAFSMLSTGMNGFINAQGFPTKGMLTTIIGAGLNLILDPIFIFVFHMGVGGAALATVISQFVSAIWVLHFLSGPKVFIRLQTAYMPIDWKLIRSIAALGASGFVMQANNCLVQVACNATLQTWGGDLYVGVMTVLNSVREVLSLAITGIGNGTQPVLGYNYGAKRYDRVKEGIRFSSILGISYTALVWLLILAVPHLLFLIFTSDPATIEAGIPALKLYFFGYVFMAFQFGGQSVFQSLGYAKRAIFFSILRKTIIVIPLTLLLPHLGFGINGVFMAEPISNAIGGLACFITMWLTVYRKLGKEVT